jgi:hypothetical protein
MLKTENHFVCELKKPVSGEPDCTVDFYYDPGSQGKPPQWPAGIQVALSKIVAVTHPLTGHTTFYCCDEHAIEAIGMGQHLPPVPPKIAPATEADMNAAKRGMKAVEQMRDAKPS